jgi:putative transposase
VGHVGPHGRAGKPRHQEFPVSRDHLDWKHGRPPRLSGHDYRSTGAYFVTTNAFQRSWLFGEVGSGQVQLNQYGRILEEEWLRSQLLRREVALDAFVVMPDHFHGIVVLSGSDEGNVCETAGAANNPGACLRRHPRSLGSLMAGFKSATTRRINTLRGSPGRAVWQSNYHEHVIRNERELAGIRTYIQNNPLKYG